MKNIALFILLNFATLFFSCKEEFKNPSNKVLTNSINDSIEPLICYFPLEQPPKYINGTNDELHQLIYSQLKYPDEGCIEGTTILTFVINKKGKIESTKIYRSISKKIDHQLEELIRKYEFEPGRIDGKVHKFQLAFPFKIQLN